MFMLIFKMLINYNLYVYRHLKANVEVKSIPFPEELFGRLASDLKPAKCIVLNILEVISSMLINKDTIGDNGDDFNFKFSYVYNENGTRVFAGCSSGEWFRKTEITVVNKFGEDVLLLGIIFNAYNI